MTVIDIRGKHNKIFEEIRKRRNSIMALHKEEMPPSKIAMNTGIDKDTVETIIRQMGFTPHGS